MASNPRELSTPGSEINRAIRIVDENLPLPVGSSLSALETQDRLNLRREVFRQVLAKLLENKFLRV